MEIKNYLSELQQLRREILNIRYLLRRLASEGNYWLEDSRVTIASSVRADVIRVFGRFTELMREGDLSEIAASRAEVFGIYALLQGLYLREGLVFEEVENWPAELGYVLKKRPEIRMLLEKPL